MLNVVLLCVARISWRFNSMILIEFENFFIRDGVIRLPIVNRLNIYKPSLFSVLIL